MSNSTCSRIERADGLKVRDRFELIYPIFATWMIANLCFVFFVHVQKMYLNILAAWVLRAQVAWAGKIPSCMTCYLMNFGGTKVIKLIRLFVRAGTSFYFTAS